MTACIFCTLYEICIALMPWNSIELPTMPLCCRQVTSFLTLKLFQIEAKLIWYFTTLNGPPKKKRAPFIYIWLNCKINMCDNILCRSISWSTMLFKVMVVDWGALRISYSSKYFISCKLCWLHGKHASLLSVSNNKILLFFFFNKNIIIIIIIILVFVNGLKGDQRSRVWITQREKINYWYISSFTITYLLQGKQEEQSKWWQGGFKSLIT